MGIRSLKNRIESGLRNGEAVEISNYSSSDLRAALNQLGGPRSDYLRGAKLYIGDFKVGEAQGQLANPNYVNFDFTDMWRNIQNNILSPQGVDEVPTQIQKATGQLQYGRNDQVNGFREALNTLGRPKVTLDFRPDSEIPENNEETKQTSNKVKKTQEKISKTSNKKLVGSAAATGGVIGLAYVLTR